MTFKINHVLEEASIEFDKMLNNKEGKHKHNNRSRKIINTQNVVMKYAEKLKYQKHSYLLKMDAIVKEKLVRLEEDTSERKIVQLQKRIIEEALRLRKDLKMYSTHPIERNYLESPLFSASIPKPNTLTNVRNTEGKIVEERTGYRNIQYIGETGDYLTPFNFKTFIGLQKLWEMKGRSKSIRFTYPELCRAIYANVDGGMYEILRASLIKLSRTLVTMENDNDTLGQRSLRTDPHYLIQINQVPSKLDNTFVIQLNEHLYHGLTAGNIVYVNLLTFLDFSTNTAAMLYPLLISLVRKSRRLDLEKVINHLVLSHLDRRKALKQIREALDELLECKIIAKAEFVRKGRSYRYVDIEYGDQNFFQPQEI